jgi:hypothetical protein
MRNNTANRKLSGPLAYCGMYNPLSALLVSMTRFIEQAEEGKRDRQRFILSCNGT